MVVYWTMAIYVLIVGMFARAAGTIWISEDGYYRKLGLGWAAMVMVLPIFLIGMRTAGADTRGYIYGFQNFSSNLSEIFATASSSKCVGWNVYVWAVHTWLTKSPYVFLMVTAILQGCAVIKFYRKHSMDYSFSLLLFFLSGTFMYMINGIRQCLAMAIIMFFSDYLFERKNIRFAIVVLIAASVHVSTIVWLPLMFVVQGKLFNKKTVILSVVFILTIFFVDRFTGLLADGLNNTVYAGYTEQFENDDGSNVLRTIIMLVPVLLALVKKREIEELNDSKIDIMVNISVVAVLMSALANVTSGILLGRMPVYFNIYTYALFPVLLSYLYYGQNGKSLRTLCYAGYFMYFAYFVRGTYYVSDFLRI